MPQFSDEYFRDLPPRDRRYDTPVADQLVFSVFPNGVKAWVHVYPCDDFVRRRTMGLFPDMSFAAARAALEQSRRIAEVDAQQVRPGRPARQIPTGTIAIVAVAAALASLVTYLVMSPVTPPPETPSTTGTPAVSPQPAVGVPASVAPQDPAGRNEDDQDTAVDQPADVGTARAATAAPGSTSGTTTDRDESPTPRPSDEAAVSGSSEEPASEEAPVPAAPADDHPVIPADSPTRTDAGDVAAEATSSGDEIASESTTSVPPEDASGEVPGDADTSPASAAEPVPGTAGPETAGRVDTGQETGAAGDDEPEDAGDPVKPAGSAPASDAPTQDDDPEDAGDQGDPAASAPTSDAADAEPISGAADGSPAAPDQPVSSAEREPGSADPEPPGVSRAVLTSAVEDREPTDRLTGPQTLPASGDLTVYFFTEVRGFASRTMTHRWSHLGEPVAELPFTVGEGARWRVFSSKDIGREGAGDWSVEIVDDAGNALQTVDFTVQPPAPIEEEAGT